MPDRNRGFAFFPCFFASSWRNKILSKEEEQGIWGFKALKQRMKLLFSMSAFKEFTECYTQLLGQGRVQG